MKRKFVIILSVFMLAYVISDSKFSEKAVSASAQDSALYTAGGETVGIKLYSDGIMCVDFDNSSVENPAYSAGIRKGDIIISVNGNKPLNSDELAKIIKEAEGDIKVIFDRDGERGTATITPKVGSDGIKRLGMWVRDSVGGVGTVTLYDREKGSIVTLGHSVTDSDTGRSFKVGKGYITNCEIVSVEKSLPGEPGEICGKFCDEENVYAYITENKEHGLYANDSGCKDWGSESYYAADKNEVYDGGALIFTDIMGGDVKPYTVAVKRLVGARGDMLVEITDKRLLSLTGGIVQGMSGCPIIQNGKIIGAVTHVFVDNPKCGYGIYIEKMLQ